MKGMITIQIDNLEYKTTRETISKSTFLSELFSDKETSSIFIDKNKEDFESVLSSLRNPSHVSIPSNKEYLYDEYGIEKPNYLIRAPTCYMCLFYIFCVWLLLSGLSYLMTWS